MLNESESNKNDQEIHRIVTQLSCEGMSAILKKLSLILYGKKYNEADSDCLLMTTLVNMTASYINLMTIKCGSPDGMLEQILESTITQLKLNVQEKTNGTRKTSH